MIKFLIAFVLMFLAPNLASAKPPVKCPKGDKACEKKKKAAAKKAPPKKSAKKTEKKPHKTAKKTSAHEKKKKKTARQFPPPTDLGEPTPHDEPVVSTPAPDTLTPPMNDMNGGSPAATASKDSGSKPSASKSGDLDGDIFPESSGSTAPSTTGSSGGSSSDSDFDIGDELPSE